MNLDPVLKAMSRGHVPGLLMVFAAYLAVLIFYAGLYYLVYRFRPRAYLFNVDIMRDQTARFTAKHRDELERQRNRLEVAAELRDALEQGERRKLEQLQTRLEAALAGENVSSPVPETPGFWSPNLKSPEVQTVRYRVQYVPTLDPPGVGNSPLTLEVRDSAGKHLWTWESELIGGSTLHVTKAVMVRAAEELFNRTSRSIEHEERMLNDTDAAERSVWSFWDFLYFSGITLSTVGFGDILPNSTGVRLLVLSEVLVGLVLLVVVLNVILVAPQ